MNNNTITVAGVETFSTVDYPDHISAVVFMQGCPWRCPFCHNSELQQIGLETEFVWAKFLDFLRRRQGILDAVVFSGGEPLVQNGLSSAIQEVKSLGYKTGLHTGGYRPEKLSEVLAIVDWVGFDIKAPLNAKSYRQITGPDHFSEVYKSLEALIASGKDFECRTTCDPRFLHIDDIEQIAKELSDLGIKKYYLQKYRPISTDKQTTEDISEHFFSDLEKLRKISELFTEFEIRR